MSAENNGFNIQSIAFEGPHRAGKGCNINLLSEYLANKNIPSIILKGDGSRPGVGSSEGDPFSKFWQSVSLELHKPDADTELWEKAAYILSKEYLIWKEIYFPRKIKQLGVESGVIILDRSILSRTLIPREKIDPHLWNEEIPNSLYKKPESWKGQEIEIVDVTPNLIFSLYAPLETLISRLDKDDAKYEFRKRNLIRRYEWYIDAINYIPESLKSRVVSVNTNRDLNLVFEDIKSVLKERMGI